ncbi:MAG TPA: XdhC/CoxI family protein [Sphaerochaeta sp.]|nr:XdhC/CoxI family protein [Sphaerochaeta sp.]
MNHYYTTLLERLQKEVLIRKTVISGIGIGDEALFSDTEMIASLSHQDHTWDEEDLLIERLDSKIELVLCGGGHVAKALYVLAKELEMEISILDEREEFCNKGLYPQAKLFCAPFEETLRSGQDWIKPYFVIITRGHAFDQECLEQCLALPHSYIGMIGSRNKVAITMGNLEERGYSKETLSEVYSPIGLSIGAVTAPEIAISILAQILSVYRKKRPSVRLDPKLLRTLVNKTGYILARVVKKSGSAPCEVGFQIAVFGDGSTQGTVGGGLVEAYTIKHAKAMLSDTSLANQVIEYGLDNTKAGSLGMICGGEVSILFQRQ